MTKVSITGLVILVMLVIWGAVGVTGAVKAWSPMEQAEAGRVTALDAEVVRHTTVLNAVVEAKAVAIAAEQAATAATWARMWRGIWAALGTALCVGFAGFGTWFMEYGRARVDGLKEVERKRGNNPVWSPCGPQLASRNDGGRTELLCELSGATAHTDNREEMRTFREARLPLIEQWLNDQERIEVARLFGASVERKGGAGAWREAVQVLTE